MRSDTCRLLSSSTLIACASLAMPANAQYRHGGDIGNSVTANEADGIILRSIVDLDQMATDTGIAAISLGGNGNDCWGYTSGSGREYALMGTSEATVIYEVTDPFNPTYVEHIVHAPATLWSDIKTYSTYAYVVVDGGGALGNGIQVIDLSDVDNANVSLLNEYKPSGLLNSHNIAINETSGRLYTCIADAISNGIAVFDLAADPVNPPLLGSYTMPGISGAGTHDAQAITMSSGPWAGKEIVFCFAEDLGIVIVDMTNPAAPVWLSTTPYANMNYSHQGWFDETTNLLYANDELDEYYVGVNTSTRIFDCTDLTAPIFLGVVNNPRQAIDHNLYISNGIMYQANYTSGVHMFDVASNPTDPQLLGYFDTSFTYENVSFNGAWNVYPFFDSTTILVSDLASGLFVLDAEPAQSGGFPFKFSFPDGVPRSLPPVGASIDVLIEGQNGRTVGASNRWLHVLIDGVKTNFALQHVGGDLYRANFPVLDCGEVIWWLGTDDDTGLHVHTPLHAPVEVFRATVNSSVFRTFYEDGDNHVWTLGLGTDTATTGMWENGISLPSGPQPGFDSLDENDFSFYTQNALIPWAGVGANDIDGGHTTLVSPVFTGDGLESYLSMFIWYSNESNGNTSVDDVLQIDIYSDVTGVWSPLETISTNTLGWERRTWRLNDYTVPSSVMQLRIIASDTGAGSLVEAAIDHVEVYVDQTSSNQFDLNADNTIDGADLGLFLASWGSPGITDFNGDGTTDGADLGLQLASWGLCVGGL